MPKALTTSNGNPVENNQDSQTAGPDGPILVQDFHLIDKLAHFDRERIPERVVHAKGAGAHGHFEVTSDLIGRLCKAKLFQKGSNDTDRDPRGFAVKFYTEEGNWDMVGNNTPVFFIRDPSKFPDFIHTQKRNPQSNLKDPDMFWDFLSLVPESIHQVTILFSDRGTPDGYRFMDGFSGHAFKLVDAAHEYKFVKFHFKSNQGIRNLNAGTDSASQNSDPDHATRDLFSAIDRGDFPSWTVCIQVMEPKDAAGYRWNILDITKVWPHKDYPLIPIGQMVLNKNPANYFAETEQSAFSPSHLVPGIEPTHDKMLQGRLFSYPDTHRHRLGPNYTQIPINRPYAACLAHHQRDGLMTVNGNFGPLPNYEPNSFGGPHELGRDMAGVTFSPMALSGSTVRQPFELVDDDFVQAGNLYRIQSEEAKARLVNNVVSKLKDAKRFIQERQVAHFKRADPEYGLRIERGLAAANVRV